jgi:hypothetical protein
MRYSILTTYTRYLATNPPALGSPDAEAIATIALQCPLEGGSAVYLARGLYSGFGGEQAYDDLQACDVEERTNEPSMVAQADAQPRLLILPNPAHDQFTLRWDAPATTEGVIRVWASDGRLVRQQIVALGTHTIDIQSADFATGLYYCQYSTPDSKVLTGVLSIQE